MPGMVTISRAEVHRLVKQIKQKAGELAAAIRKLRDTNGWRVLGYESWAECCEREFNYSKRHANRLIESQKVIEQVGHQCPTSPPPTHAAILARLPEDQRADCWADYVDECDQQETKPTAAKLRAKVDVWLADNEPVDLGDSEVVDEPANEVVDADPLVEQCSQEWDRWGDWRQVCGLVTACVNRVGNAAVADALDQLWEAIRPTEPMQCQVCDQWFKHCESDGKQRFCSHCLEAGSVVDHGDRMRRSDEWREFDSGPAIKK